MKLAILFFAFALLPLNQFKASPIQPLTPTPPPPPHSPSQLWNFILALSFGYGLQSSQSNRFKTPLPIGNPIFTIHGLWPNDLPPPSSRTKPTTLASSTYCYPSSLSAAEIQSLRATLLSKWPDVYDYYNATAALEFWGREWNKHGTCSKFTKIQYFQKTLSLFNDLNLPSIVKDGGALSPDDHKIYYEHDVLQAFNTHTPYIVCAGSKGNAVLTDLYFCLDNKANTFANCSSFYTSDSNKNCQSGFKLLKT